MRCVQDCRRQTAKVNLLSMLSNIGRIDRPARSDGLICDGHPGSLASSVDIGTEIRDPLRHGIS
jgi:hypothetical protein